MRAVGRTLLLLAAIAVAVAIVSAVPGVITRARWYAFAQRATGFMAAVHDRDTAAVRRLAANPLLADQMLDLRARRPALVRSATSSLTLERGQREGDTVLVALRTTHSSCTPQGDPDRLLLAFVLTEGEYRVAWLRTVLCRPDN